MRAKCSERVFDGHPLVVDEQDRSGVEMAALTQLKHEGTLLEAYSPGGLRPRQPAGSWC